MSGFWNRAQGQPPPQSSYEPSRNEPRGDYGAPPPPPRAGYDQRGGYNQRNSGGGQYDSPPPRGSSSGTAGGAGGYDRDPYPPPPQRMGGGLPSSNRRPAPPSAGPAGGGRGGQGPPLRGPYTLICEKGTDSAAATNVASVNPGDFSSETLVMMNGQYILSVRPDDKIKPGTIGLSALQRTWLSVGITDRVETVEHREQSQVLAGMELEISWTTKKTTDSPFEEDDLAQKLMEKFDGRMFTPSQAVYLDFPELNGIKLTFKVRSVKPIDLYDAEKGRPVEELPSFNDPRTHAMLYRDTQFTFAKGPGANIRLRGSSKKMATTSILAPTFNFQQLNIGGLDQEFTTIFRRAFTSRLFPPALVAQLGLPHVKGILLHGPPGTGKTLIARKIGQMLNGQREPKVVNGPEVLSKYVGQSEENVRKLFADAEAEEKQAGEESQLHVIIFDELDAICKQRGSRSGDTGVGDSVVNQLLSKMDGVDQLNNILLIGMTNRKDMIDEALLRPGRLEVHVEIGLPDEQGRIQILDIHTKPLAQNNRLAQDVDIPYLATQTRNFSGAEIQGLVKSASSFAMSRHVKLTEGGEIKVAGDFERFLVTQRDFVGALEEIKPAFGVPEEDLADMAPCGIIPFSPSVESILKQGASRIDSVQKDRRLRLESMLLWGPPKSGKSALASKIALDSGFPFVKLVQPSSVEAMSEMQKMAHLSKVFNDAYKSSKSLVILDSVELLLEYTRVGPRFQNSVLVKIKQVLNTVPPEGKCLVIVVTSSNRSALEELDLIQPFGADIAVPTLSHVKELQEFLSQFKVQEQGPNGPKNIPPFNRQELQELVSEVQGIAGGRIDIGVKELIADTVTALGSESPVEDLYDLIREKAARRLPPTNQ